MGMGGCSCRLVWILSASGLFNGFCNTILLIHFWALKHWWQIGCRRAGRIKHHRQCLWLTELQSVVYQLQLVLSEEKKKRGVTLTTLRFGGGLCVHKCEASLKEAVFPQKSFKTKSTIKQYIQEDMPLTACLYMKSCHARMRNLKNVRFSLSINIPFTTLRNGGQNEVCSIFLWKNWTRVKIMNNHVAFT